MRSRGGEDEELEEISDFEFLPTKAVSGAGAAEDFDVFEDEIDPGDVIAEDTGGPVTGGGPPGTREGIHGPDVARAIRRQKKLIEKLVAMRKKAQGAQRRKLQRRVLQSKAVVAALKGKPAPKPKKKGKKK